MMQAMDTVLDRPWTTESFLAWEDQQEFKYEFDGRHVIPMTGGSIAHQRIVANAWLTLLGLIGDRPLMVLQEMRLRIGPQIRYPDVVICAGPLEQSTRTLTDALVVFEVLSDDTATTDRVVKLRDYAALPSLRSYVLLEQTAVAATLFHRDAGGEWRASPHTDGALALPGVDLAVPLAELYRGLTFPAQA
jgi:Uma2 family endonuclease